MTAALKRLDHGPSIAELAFGPQDPTQARRNDAQIGIQELQVLRADLDLVAPPEAATEAEPLARLYQGTIEGGDRLRLPMITAHSGPDIRAAVSRILSVDTSKVGANRDDVMKEELLRRVLSSLQMVNYGIQQKTQMALSRY